MKTVRISYNKDNSLIGTTRVVEDQEARDLVREGRAVYVDDEGDVDTARAAAPGDGLDDLTKADLLKRAAQQGVRVTQSSTKDEIAEALRAATTATPGGSGPASSGTSGTAGTSTTGGATVTTSGT